MRNFLKKHSEFITLPLAIMLWYFLPFIYRRIDPTAGVHDLGLLQTFAIASIGLFFGTAIVWLTLRISVPHVHRTLDDFFINNGKNITEWQRVIFSLVFFFGLLLAYALIVLAFV